MVNCKQPHCSRPLNHLIIAYSKSDLHHWALNSRNHSIHKTQRTRWKLSHSHPWLCPAVWSIRKCKRSVCVRVEKSGECILLLLGPWVSLLSVSFVVGLKALTCFLCEWAISVWECFHKALPPLPSSINQASSCVSSYQCHRWTKRVLMNEGWCQQILNSFWRGICILTLRPVKEYSQQRHHQCLLSKQKKYLKISN